MTKMIIADRLNRICLNNDRSYQFISFRKLSQKEVAFASKNKIRRFYLPTLSDDQAKIFFIEFDKFWDQLTFSFTADHPFWRNVISSKMQEWEYSAGYLAIVLYSLSLYEDSDNKILIIICSSIEEKDIFLKMAEKKKWEVIVYGFKGYYFRVSQECINFIQFCRKSYVCLSRKIFFPKKEVPTLSKGLNKWVLIVSQFYPKSLREGKYNDPFFGNLHEIMNDKGFSCIYLDDCLVSFNKQLKDAIKKIVNTRIIIPYLLLSWPEIVAILLRILFKRITIPSCHFMGYDFSPLMKWNARRFSDYRTILSEIYYKAVSNLSQGNKFEQLINIYEGNVYERACLQAFAENGKATTLGYGQGVIYPLNLKLRLTEKEKDIHPCPEKIICTGTLSKELFSRIGNREDSHLLSGCSLRYIPRLDDVIEENKSKEILVALDGVCSTVIFFDWLCAHADLFKKYIVKIRAHPNVPFEDIQAQSVQKLPDNFIISSNSLDDDIKSSFCVLYRHSSVGIQALLNGVCAIHLAVDTPLFGDPIEGLSAGKWVANNSSQLRTVLKKVYFLDREEKKRLVILASEEISSYFSKPTNELLDQFIIR